jgi:hypothetical protein
LEQKDGEIVTIALSNLSPDDQEYVKLHFDVALGTSMCAPLVSNDDTSMETAQAHSSVSPPTAKRGSVLVSVVVTLIILGLLAYGAFYFIRHYW